MKLKIKMLDIQTGGPLVIVVSRKFAEENMIYGGDRLEIKKVGIKFIGIVDISESGIKDSEVGLFHEWKGIGFSDSEEVEIKLLPKPSSISAIKKKLKGEELSKDEIYDIIHDITFNELSDIELAVFVSGVYTRGMSLEEIYHMTKAMVKYGQKLNLRKKMIVDKHSIGGVPGNRTTPIIIPIVASAGLVIPKTSSRAITSPAGTADTIESFCDVSFTISKIKDIIKKTNACMVWGGSLNLAPADEKIIRVEHPVSLDPVPQLLSSVMAKKYSVGATYLLVDIPVGREAKVQYNDEAERLKEQFIKLGRKLGIKVEAVITNGSQPIGNGIGPNLEAKDVLYILTNDKKGPVLLREKALNMAGKIFEMTGTVRKGQGYTMAKKILESGRAYKKFQQIVREQNGNPDIRADQINLGKYSETIKSKQKGVIMSVSNRELAKIALALGNPKDKKAGIYLYVHAGDRTSRGEKLITIYSDSREKFVHAKKIVDLKKIFYVK